MRSEHLDAPSRSAPPAAPVPVEPEPHRALTRLPADVLEIVDSCLRTADGGVWCWGERSSSHQLVRMDLPPVSRVLPMYEGACGWTDDGGRGG